MSQDLTTVLLPFPANLMSSARTPTNMPTDFAREIRNMYMKTNGAGAKRNGVVKTGGALASGVIVQLMYYIQPAGNMQILAVTDIGKIYLKNEATWTEVYAGLNPLGTVRWAHFAGKLVVTNGVDDMLEWDGEYFKTVFEYVKDLSANLTYVDASTFTIEGLPETYAIGTKLKLRLGVGTFVETTVASISGETPLTITTADAVLTNALDEAHYAAKPPRFANIYAAHDRLWGMGNGALKANEFSNSVDRNRIFYTSGVNEPTDWYDTNGNLQSINLESKLPVIDELVGMAVKDSMTVFFFRNYTQIWGGLDPTASGDFSWVKTIPLGAIHGSLIMEMPNDIAFFTRFGARTISRVLQTEQLDVGDFGSEVDPSIADSVSRMLANDADYRRVQKFRYDKQGWFGFKPLGDALVFQATGTSTGWAVFDGIFNQATAFLNTPDGKLYLAKGGQLYAYDEQTWADDTDDITTLWFMPWVKPGNKQWANKYTELISEQGAAVQVQMKRYKNYNASSYISTITNLQTAADYWEEANWDNGFWDNGAPQPEKKRDHFVADVLAYAIENKSTAGPVTLFGLKIYGVKER